MPRFWHFVQGRGPEQLLLPWQAARRFLIGPLSPFDEPHYLTTTTSQDLIILIPNALWTDHEIAERSRVGVEMENVILKFALLNNIILTRE